MADEPKIREQLTEERTGWKDRVREEQEDLAGKVDRLHNFIQSSAFYGVADEEKGLLDSQLSYMRGYLNTLNARIALHNKEE